MTDFYVVTFVFRSATRQLLCTTAIQEAHSSEEALAFAIDALPQMDQVIAREAKVLPDDTVRAICEHARRIEAQQ